MLFNVVIFWIFSIVSGFTLKSEIGQQDSVKPHIAGGENAKIGEFPHQVLITKNGKVSCGGSILTKSWILANYYACFSSSGESTHVVAGEHNIREEEGSEQVVTIEKFIKHPDFKNNKYVSNNIALIKLATPLKFNKRVKPVSLWKKSDGPSPPLGKAIVSGWGTPCSAAPPCRPANILQKINVTVFDQSDCQKIFGDGYEPSNMLCAGTKKEGKDVCGDDWGSPLMTLTISTWKQVGIVSSVFCGEHKLTSIYVNVVKFEEFIKQHVPEYYEQFE